MPVVRFLGDRIETVEKLVSGRQYFTAEWFEGAARQLRITNHKAEGGPTQMWLTEEEASALLETIRNEIYPF